MCMFIVLILKSPLSIHKLLEHLTCPRHIAKSGGLMSETPVNLAILGQGLTIQAERLGSYDVHQMARAGRRGHSTGVGVRPFR